MTDNKITLACPVCNHEASFYKNLKEITLYYCGHCNHCFTDIETIQNQEKYSKEYFGTVSICVSYYNTRTYRFLTGLF